MPRKPSDDLVIRPRMSSPMRLALVLAAIVVVGGISAAAYWGGRSALYQRLESSSKQVEALKARLRESQDSNRAMEQAYHARRTKLEAELKETRDRLDTASSELEDTKSSLAKVTRQIQIDESAYKGLRKQLDDSSRQIADLGKELKFYRSIISPANGRSGVRIQDFELERTDKANEYRYRLTLIQALEHESMVKGSVRFEINGTEGGAVKTIRSPDPSQERISADFKYFQNFAGTFKFPANFAPAEIKVIFKGADKAVVERTYPWPMHGLQEGDRTRAGTGARLVRKRARPHAARA